MTNAPDTQSPQATEAIEDTLPAPATPSASVAASAPTPADKPSPIPADKPSPMSDDRSSPLDDVIASIRAAVAPGVSAEARTAGAAACRAILAALETQVGQPLVPATPAKMASGILAQLASMSREQLLEFLRSKFPAGPPSDPSSQPTAGPRFHLISIPPVPRNGGTR